LRGTNSSLRCRAKRESDTTESPSLASGGVLSGAFVSETKTKDLDTSDVDDSAICGGMSRFPSVSDAGSSFWTAVWLCRVMVNDEPDGVRGGARTEPDGSDRIERVDEFRRANDRDMG
jgi:hypothetical protein